MSRHEEETERLLQPTALLDFRHPSLEALIHVRGWRALPEFERIAAIYVFVRDEIPFGYNLTDDLPAWITRSINPPSTTFFGKLFGRRANAVDPDSEHQTLVVLHPTHLIVVVSGAQRGTSALSVPLARASMQQLGPTSDDGFSVTGFGADAQPGSLHIGVGAPDGTACQEAVRAAIVGAKNP
mgnify:CR=1 FL=1